MKMGLSWLVFAVILCAHCIDSCGITTHIEIGHRALKHFENKNTKYDYNKLLLKHPDAYQAGNPFPDAFYPTICAKGIYHDISETAHWAPFINATVNYIRNHHPQPWDEDTEKLVVFLFGFTSHQVADVLWHSLGIKQGFLRTMGKINFHGSFPAAHSVGDFGGDILNQFELNLNYIPDVTEWYVPVDDLYNIFTEYYGHEAVPRSVITECTTILFLGRLGEKLAVAKLFPEYANKSPFMVDQLSDFFEGGMDDMAGWTQTIWGDVVQMLDHGSSTCDIPHNTLFINCTKSNNVPQRRMPDRAYTQEKNGFFVEPAYHGLTVSMIDSHQTGRGMVLKAGSEYKKIIHDAVNQKKTSNIKQLELNNVVTPGAVYTINETYAKAGWALVTGDVNMDGNDDLLVGAPGYGTLGSPQEGRVFVVYGTSDGLPMKNMDLMMADKIFAGPTGFQARFGSSIAVLDVDLDGVNDIVVGAPSAASVTLQYTGAVFVYLGLGGGSFKDVGVHITCKDQFCNLGWAMTTGDLNGDGKDDLVLGSPYAPGSGEERGVVAGLYSNKKYHNKTTNIELSQLDWIEIGKQDYGWFGHNLKVHRTPSNTSMLLVGQPTYRLCFKPDCSYSPNDTQSVGAITIYKLGKEAKPTLMSTMQGKMNFEQLGSSFAVGSPYGKDSTYIAIGSAAKGRPGKPALTGHLSVSKRLVAPAGSVGVKGKIADLPIDFQEAGEMGLYKLDENGINFTRTAWFDGDRKFDRFGANIQIADVNGDSYDDIIVTSPLRTDDITEEFRGAEEGRVRIYFGGSGFPHGDATANCGLFHVQPCPDKRASVIMNFGEDHARFGTNVEVLKAKNKVNVIVTALHSSAGARLSGAVTIFQFL